MLSTSLESCCTLIINLFAPTKSFSAIFFSARAFALAASSLLHSMRRSTEVGTVAEMSNYGVASTVY
uniref:Uncharacterized protein n=1 Tax=Arundo donax TaxID=35708 RepID=A0A0A9CYG6_ARUDO